MNNWYIEIRARSTDMCVDQYGPYTQLEANWKADRKFADKADEDYYVTVVIEDKKSEFVLNGR